MPEPIILFPYSGNTREALMVIENINRVQKTWNVVGFIDDDPKTHGQELHGVKVLGGRDVLENHEDAFVLAVPGNPDSFLKRKDIIGGLNVADNKWATVIDPSASIASDVKVGVNTLIMPEVVVSPEASVGAHCVILPNTVVSHNSTVGDYCCLGSNVSVSGDVTVGENCYIGTGTSIRNGLTVGARTLIGIGSNVIKSVESGVVVAGNPAKFMRKAE